MISAGAFWKNDLKVQVMQILPKQISIFGETEWTSLQADSPAKMQVRQSRWEEKDNSDLKEKGPDYGGTCAGRLMKFVHGGLLQKTLPISQELTTEEILQKSSIRFPDWGTMRNGRLCTLRMQVRPKEEPGVTWLLTPTASDYKRVNISSPMYARRLNRSSGAIAEQLYRLGNRDLLNHQFVAWIMGFPLNHLKCMANLD